MKKGSALQKLIKKVEKLLCVKFFAKLFFKKAGSFFAEGEKTICYIVFEDFRQPTPDSSEPNGDERIPVSMSFSFFSKKELSKGDVAVEIGERPGF